VLGQTLTPAQVAGLGVALGALVAGQVLGRPAPAPRRTERLPQPVGS
jgi:probable blue pigment (indigoidine) exporter